MADIELVIKISEEAYKSIKIGMRNRDDMAEIGEAVENGIPLTPDVLADMLMEERIRGELKQDISYSKDVIDDVRCRLTVDIKDWLMLMQKSRKYRIYQMRNGEEQKKGARNEVN